MSVMSDFKSDLLKMLQRPTFELSLLEKQWSTIEAQFKREQIRLARKVPINDPIRSGVDLFGPLDRGLDEILHTRAIGYLLNPNAQHGLKKKALTAVIDKVKDVSPRGVGATQFLAILHQERTTISVTPEYRWRVEDFKRTAARCDIRIELSSPASTALLIIENKIRSTGTNEQLKWYERKANEWRKENERGIDPLLIYLTRTDLQKIKASDSKWLDLTYIELAAALRKVWLEEKDGAGREWLSLYISSITGRVLGINGRELTKAPINFIETYLGEGA